MEDIQNSPAKVAMSIDRVGVRDLTLPLVVRDRESGSQHTMAKVALSVDLPAHFKGTHMSRFVEALEDWSEELDYKSFFNLLSDILRRLEARSAHAKLSFPYCLKKTSPVSGRKGFMSYDCSVEGELIGDKLEFTLGVEVPVMTVCPCSKAISKEGAHSQRAVITIKSKSKGFVWIEDLVEIAEQAGSCEVYSLLKREDEKYVTEKSFSNPTFVEDVVRNVAMGLENHSKILWYKVDVESFESIHNHCAFASIAKK
ncbi:GTP cyclohydrolase FolE2 [Maridesulfovibrio hydrothermalis]|uniref:GTP cyclohydrolase FolE2 n=1 Tax=Maridesulfovibrio hydrothermalis AM13 = DSM 14728 TaxID=1121451 RepID=L0RE68_9BACT|nr:GTP cyclohydrolase FolE2 [Maridesulfovibrio hydrothermalis]CCO23861.1 GTP cyclohydrolase folE2 [Maridesulfovibrio hydrothermalis AM13 = DSM 14728]